MVSEAAGFFSYRDQFANCPLLPHSTPKSCIIKEWRKTNRINFLSSFTHPNHSNFMTYNTDFVEARAEDIFEDWVKSFFVDLTPLDESALYALALDTAIEEAN